MWQGSSSPSIIETLLDALIALLRLDFVHLRIKNGEKGETVQFRKSSTPARAIPAELIGHLLEGHLNQKYPMVVDNPLGSTANGEPSSQVRQTVNSQPTRMFCSSEWQRIRQPSHWRMLSSTK
jgi:hypothetical protein